MTDQHDIVLEKSAELWNEYLKINDLDKHPDDNNDVRFHIHAIQNILYTQLYKKNNQVVKEIPKGLIKT